MAALMRSFDWAQAPLGAIETWPQSLRTSLGICLSSRVPILIGWGADLLMFYNDAYRQILGTNHPEGIGQPGRIGLADLWHVVGPLLESVLTTGTAACSEDQRRLIDRDGVVEECYFTFSGSPILGETGAVDGVFVAVTETTNPMRREWSVPAQHHPTAPTSSATANAGQVKQWRDTAEQQQVLKQEAQAAKREAEAAYQRIHGILACITDAFVAFDRQWRYTYANPAALQLLQKSLDELIGQNVWEVFPDQMNGRAYQELHRVMDEQVAVSWEEFGEIAGRWLEIRAYPSPDGISLYFQDISDRKHTEQALRESEARLRLATEGAALGMWFWDLDTDTLVWTEQAKAMFGLPSDTEMSMERFLQAVHPDDHQLIQTVVSDLRVGLFHTQTEYRTLWPDGTVRWILAKGNSTYSADGSLLSTRGVLIDITDRKQAEDALKRSEERLRVSQELSLDAFTILDCVRDHTGAIVDFVWSYVNPKAAEILQRPVEALVGSRLLDVLPRNEVNSELFARYVQVAETGEPHDIELPYHADGISGWFRNMTVKIKDGVAVFFSDISDRKYREQNAEFLASVSQDLARSLSMEQLFECIGAATSRHFNFSILTFSEIDAATHWADIIYNSHDPDVKSAVGRHRLTDFLSDDQIAQLKAGRVITIDDVSTLDIEGGDTAYQPYKVHSTIVAPYLVDGQLTFIFSGSRGQRSHWRSDEIELMQELAARIWIRIERDRAEEKLRRSEEAFRTISNAAPALVWATSPAGENIYFNDRWYEFTGLTEAESLGLGWVKTMHPDDAARILPYWERCRQTGGVYEGEVRYRRHDGTYCWHAFRALPRHNASGEIEAWYGLSLDISDRKHVEEALKTSEARLRVALQNSPITVSNQDRDLRYTWIHNPVMHEMHEILGKQDHDFLPPDDAVRLTAIKQRVLETRIGAHEEIKITRDGLDYYYDLTVEPLMDDCQSAIGITCAAVDISDLKRTEIDLRESERRFRRLVESNMFGVAFGGFNGSIHYVNDYFLAMVGYTRSEIERGQVGWRDITPPEYLHLDEQAGQELRTRGVSTPFEKEYIRKDGTRVPILIGAALLDEPYDQHQEIIAFYVDLSDRKQAETALTLSENRYRTLAHAVSQLMWVNDANGNMQFYNQQWQTYTGIQDLELGVGLWVNVVHPDDFQLTLEARNRAIAMGEAYEVECRLKRADETYRWHLARVVPFKDEDGQILYWFGTATDIDDRKQAEAERERLLHQSEAARDAAEAANRIKDEFLAVVSHELRSPLNPILGWSKLLRTRQLDAQKTERALEVIERNAQMQAQLINDLLDVSRILRGKLSLDACPVNLESIIYAAIETVRLAAETKSIQIQVHVQPDVAPVAGDPGRLQQIVWNLLSNAVKFTAEGGRVDVRLEQVERGGVEENPSTPTPHTPHPTPLFAQLTITDTGKGIPPDFLPYVFEHFRQESSATTRRFGGLGLGLAIVRYLVELHGGTVWADSPGEGLGATFTVQLPLTSQPSSPSPNSLSAEPLTNLQGSRILVVDDDDSTREFLVFLLELNGANVLSAAGAQDAIALLTQFQPDVLLSDIGMPNVDGYMLLQQVRALPPEQGGRVPAIALTAYAGEFDQQQAMAVGFAHHIAKPAEPEQLVTLIASLLKTAKSAPTPCQAPTIMGREGHE